MSERTQQGTTLFGRVLTFFAVAALILPGCGKTPPPAPTAPNPAMDTAPPTPQQAPAEASPAATSEEPRTAVAAEIAAPAETTTQPALRPSQAESPRTASQSGPTLDEALAALKIPPDWFAAVETQYDTNLPWEDARLEIRRLLSLGGASGKQAIKLTCIYREKNDIGDGHEYPMYLFMGGELAWATKAYVEFTDRLLDDPDSFNHIGAFLCLASCYSHFGEYQKALATLNTAMTRLPDPPWRIARQADIHDRLGDLYAKQGENDSARQQYAEAVRLYPTSNQPYGRHLLKRRATQVQSKLDLLDLQSLASATLRDGTYTAEGLGYSGDEPMKVTLTIRAGRISNIDVEHSEKIDQGATTIIPERIIAQQSLQVDAITGATVTCDAIIDAAFRALKQAGLN